VITSNDNVDAARALLRADGPRAALEQLKKDVRKVPREPRLRIFLFQLFCVVGEWDRALTQLAVAAEFDPEAVPMAQTYRAVIRCEMLRERVFKGLRTPTFLGEPEQWMSLLVEANRVLATGAEAEAASLRDAAFEQAPAISGQIDGKPFNWIADADPRLGPVLEAVVEGKYYWVPFGRIARVSLEPPADLRDQVWMPAQFIWSSGGESMGFIPTRYPGSQSGDEDLTLARRTEWRDSNDWPLGLGQRMLATDADEVALMDLRKLVIDTSPTADTAAG
jgi:type VI secretion system protein ImpE